VVLIGSTIMPAIRAPLRGSNRRTRDPEATRNRILAAAKHEFARFGLGGARVDAIARRAKANKRMIYHYFGSKEGLFTAVLEAAWTDIRLAERELKLEEAEPLAAIERLVSFTWHYYLENPEFITLVNSENLHKARHIRDSRVIRELSRPFLDMVASILRRGAEARVFRTGIDPVQLNITIAAIGYYYLTNRHTGAIVYERDLMAPKALEERLAFNIRTVMGLVLTPAALARWEAGRAAA
jgi:AcrR family transcriptional regulator